MPAILLSVKKTLSNRLFKAHPTRLQQPPDVSDVLMHGIERCITLDFKAKQAQICSKHLSNFKKVTKIHEVPPTASHEHIHLRIRITVILIRNLEYFYK